MRRSSVVSLVVLAVLGALGVTAPEASAAPYGSRELSSGSRGDDVKEVQIRTAGWYDNCAGVPCHDHYGLDGAFGPKTTRAVKNFQKAHGLAATGRVDSATFSRLGDYEQNDGSTPHFQWGEFQEKSASCDTPNRGTFNGGYVSAWQTQQNVRYLMHRLEAVRGKLDHAHAVNIHSGYRSVQYQQCLRKRTNSAASRSQHSYGLGADATMNGVTTGYMRALAKTSQFHGIFCYSGDSHNHLDIRMDNPAGPNSWVWPGTDSAGRDVASGGSTCRGGYGSPPSTGNKPPAVGGAMNPRPPGLPSTTSAEDQFRKGASEELWMAEDAE